VNLLEEAGNTLGGYLPRFAGALALLLVGLLVAALVRRGLRRALQAAGLDDLGERWGVHDTLAAVRLPRSLSSVTASAVRLGLVIVVVFAALSLLGLQFLSASLNAGILYLPRLLAALVLLIAGLVLARLARGPVDRAAGQMDLPGPLGALAQGVVLAVFVITALAQLGVPTAVLLLLGALLIGAAGLTVALAFGLGAREVTREVSARRYVEAAYEVGQEITVGGARGRIAGFESTATVVETAGGDRLRVPHSQLVGSVVTVHG